jgi:hypothetical protein
MWDFRQAIPQIAKFNDQEDVISKLSIGWHDFFIFKDFRFFLHLEKFTSGCQ